MYTITSDYRHFITLANIDEAKRLADSIRGGVYLFPNNEPLLIYSYLDSNQ